MMYSVTCFQVFMMYMSVGTTHKEMMYLVTYFHTEKLRKLKKVTLEFSVFGDRFFWVGKHL